MSHSARCLAVALSLVSSVGVAQVTYNGDIVLIQDQSGAINDLVSINNSNPFPSHQEQFCRAAFNAARAGGLADEYDGVITFTASESLTDLDNVFQGPPVRSDGSGYARTNSPLVTTYNSSKLGQCVFMGTLGRTQSLLGGPGTEALPANPDSDWAPSLGIPIPGLPKSLTGIEIMGHEYGHHWLMGVEFDLNDGRNRQNYIRGWVPPSGENGGGMGYANQHYSRLADSRSVMYGECITDLGNGSFRLNGCERKYSHLDQYLMGLRGQNETTPMMVLENPADPGHGVDSVAMSRTQSGMTVNGYTRHDVGAADIARAMGARIPAYPTARNCWRVAFLVVLAPGTTSIPQAMLNKVNAYRNRWSPWFNFATDGRGTMDARLMGNGCLTFGTDGGIPDAGPVDPPDAGPVDPPDAGPEDAGVDPVDSGVVDPPDAAVEDAGVVVPPVDAGRRDSGYDYEPIDTGKIRPGCGCSGDPSGMLVAFALLSWAGLRRRREQR